MTFEKKKVVGKEKHFLSYSTCVISRGNENNLNRVMGSVDGAGSNGVLDLIN